MIGGTRGFSKVIGMANRMHILIMTCECGCLNGIPAKLRSKENRNESFVPIEI